MKLEILPHHYLELEKYNDLIVRIAEDGSMLPVLLHVNNLQVMVSKWRHDEMV